MLYEHPKYYEVVFSFRDIPNEAKFLHSCIQMYSRRPVSRVLELACGPAPHAGELTDLGYQYLGLDLNETMLEDAREKWSHLKPVPELFRADMVDFDMAEKVDFAFVMIGSLYLKSAAEMARHFDSVSRCLKPGGLYFLDWCIQFNDPLSYNGQNAIHREKDGITLSSDFKIKLVDPLENVYRETWTMNIDDHGKPVKLEMVEENKAIRPDEFLKFVAERDDFDFTGWWRDWDLQQPLTDYSEVYRPVAILRRTEADTPTKHAVAEEEVPAAV